MWLLGVKLCVTTTWTIRLISTIVLLSDLQENFIIKTQMKCPYKSTFYPSRGLKFTPRTHISGLTNAGTLSPGHQKPYSVPPTHTQSLFMQPIINIIVITSKNHCYLWMNFQQESVVGFLGRDFNQEAHTNLCASPPSPSHTVIPISFHQCQKLGCSSESESFSS